jgi:hypothetical protein
VKKPRSDSILGNLPNPVHHELVQWLLGGMPYSVVKQRLRDEFQIEVKSDSTLSAFWEENCGAALILKRQKAVTLADEVAAEAEKQPGRFDAATIDALKQRAFALAVQPNSDPRDVKALFMLLVKVRAQELDEDKVLIERAKLEQRISEYQDKIRAAQATLTKAQAEGGITPETLKTIEDQLNLL